MVVLDRFDCFMCKKAVDKRKKTRHERSCSAKQTKTIQKKEQKIASIAAKQAKTMQEKTEKKRVAELKKALNKKIVSTNITTECKRLFTENPEIKNMFHLMYSTVTIKDEQAFLKKLNVISTLECTCFTGGKGEMTSREHRHCIIKYTKSQQTFSRLVKDDFNGDKQYRCISFKGESIPEKAVHVINLASYIQTENGWHKKKDHNNPFTFHDLQERYDYLKEMTDDWLWWNVVYARFLDRKMKILRAKLHYFENECMPKDADVVLDEMQRIESIKENMKTYRDVPEEVVLQDFMEFLMS